MRISALLVLLLLCVRSGPSQEQVTSESCQENVELFYNSPAIATLPAKERLGIIRVLLPELKASQAEMGFDTKDLTPQHLYSILRYRELTTAAPAERVVSVMYQGPEPDGCGNHGQCPAYLLSIGPQGVRSLIAKTEPSGMSVGGSWGAAVMPRKGSTYPDLLFLATIGGPDLAVECYRWQRHAYTSGCDIPCARALAHPDQ